jgi:hypothetical protein
MSCECGWRLNGVAEAEVSWVNYYERRLGMFSSRWSRTAGGYSRFVSLRSTDTTCLHRPTHAEMATSLWILFSHE